MVRGAKVLGAACWVLGAGVLIAQPAQISLAVSGRQNANASAASAGNFVAVAWGATGGDATDVFAAISRDGGRSFGAPSRVNNVPGDARLSGEQPARVALVPGAGQDPSIVVTWTTKRAVGTELATARSNDAGKSFSPTAIVPGSDAAGNRGWESTTVDSAGHVLALWLDHREMAAGGTAMADMPAMHHDGEHGTTAQKADGAAKAQLSKLYIAALDGSISPIAVTSGVCYCCKTAFATGPDGAIYAAWRHVYPGNIRDIAFTVSRDGGRTFAAPVRVSADKWQIDGCPEDGPAIAVDSRNRVHIVWPTLVPGTTPKSEAAIGLFYAVSVDGRRFTARRAVPTVGTPHHPQLVVTSSGDVVAAWDEGATGQRRVAWARGRLSAAPLQLVRGGTMERERAVYPALASTSNGVLLTWTGGPAETSRIGAQTLP